MGYYTYITGGVIISPPIDKKQFEDFVGFPDTDNDQYFRHDGNVEGDEDVQIVNGQITVVGKTAGHSEVNVAFDESVKAYDFNEKVDELVARAKKLGHKINGSFDGDGEESEDFWRITIVDNVVTLENGSITFPSDKYHELANFGRSSKAHGNVIPREDGQRVKCLGHPHCPDCKAEHEFLAKAMYG